MRNGLALAALVLPLTLNPTRAAGTSMPKQATVNDREGWAPWTANSTQPPPEIGPVKLPPQPANGEAEILIYNALAWFDQAIEDADKLVPAAEAAADQILAGGRMYGGGSPGFVQECFSRAGGYPFFEPLHGKAQDLGQNDVLLIGQLSAKDESPIDHDLLALTHVGAKSPALVVHISSHKYVRAQRAAALKLSDRERVILLDTQAPEGSTWSDISLAQMSTTAMAWAFQGEMFSAATRKGKTFATSASDAEPHGREWDDANKGRTLNQRFTVPPIPPGKIARDYYRICQHQLIAFLEDGQADRLRLAAERMARTMKSGRIIFVVVSGHLHRDAAIVPREFVRMAIYGRTWQWQPEILESGDMLFWLGNLDYPKKEISDALSRGGEVVSLTVADGPTSDREITIRSHWSAWDSVIDVPDLPLRILPTSGVVQTVQWYALMAEIEKLYSGVRK
jgi:uncharacterized phosphosugar-binding protein